MIVGRRFRRHGQAYRCVGEREHETRDGRWTTLLVVVSFCAECGAPFRFLTTPNRAARGKINRRCDLHKAPGVPVPQKPKAPAKRRQPARRATAPGARRARSAGEAIPSLAELLA